MNIRDYYLNNFTTDLAAFMPDSRLPYFGHSWEYGCQNLDRIPADRRPGFLICLYFTILVDQGMHAHFRPYYDKFESLTRYPKYCRGLGQFQKNPRGILLYPVERGFGDKARLEELLKDGMELFVDRVDEFFRNHMPEISPRDFFEKLLHDPDVQIPLLLVMVKPELKGDLVVKAYKALRKATERRFPEENQPGGEL
jgi:hypothetical protein